MDSLDYSIILSCHDAQIMTDALEKTAAYAERIEKILKLQNANGKSVISSDLASEVIDGYV